MGARTFFTTEQQQEIRRAIVRAELNTSGEIRVHIDDKCPEDVLDRAASTFQKLKMTRTELRNGVLFYLAVVDRKFAILGDKGINEKVPADFWDSIKEEMQVHFRKEKFTEGLCRGID